MESNEILKQLEAARKKYMPEKIRAIIVAEAAPNSLDRFFYYENVRTADHLFLGIAEVLYPEAKRSYLASNRNPKIKEIILKKFQADGYYLIDLFELPISINRDSEDVAVKKLSSKLEKLATEETLVILVKATVYDIVYPRLKQKFNIINQRIDFPASGNQRKFYEKFSEAIKMLS